MPKQYFFLIVDDEPMILDIWNDLLESRGYEFELSSSYKEGLAAIQSGRKFDAVITDVRMPDGDGLQLADSLASAPHKPVVYVVSGFAEETTRIESSSPIKFVQKPCDPVALLDEIVRVLES